VAPRVAPTLFDKLTSGNQFTSGEGADPVSRPTVRWPLVDSYERFNEQALKATVKRELDWLFNTTHMAAAFDLSRYPEVQRSVLNYGVPDMAGKAGGRRVLQTRAREIRDAIRLFEPRLDPGRLDVEVQEDAERDNAMTFIVRGDVVSAVQALPVQFKTDVEVDTGAATVRD